MGGPGLEIVVTAVSKKGGAREAYLLGFEDVSLVSFWSYLVPEFPAIAKQALHTLLPFSSTYLCEAGFSFYTAIKTKYRSKLNAAADLRIKLSTIKPNIKRLCDDIRPVTGPKVWGAGLEIVATAVSKKAPP